MKKIILILCCLISYQAWSQEWVKKTYKVTESGALSLEILQPQSAGQCPAIVFYFGGGWNGGTIDQFRPQAEHLTSTGMVSVLVDYRVKSRNQTTPFDALMDAKSAIRFIRSHAKELNIDPKRIAAAGGSAGGHLAAATAIITKYDDPADNLNIDCKPNALVLFNPVIDNGPAGYGYERIGAAYPEFSPLHNIRKGLPPTIFFLGKKDALIPVETGEYYQMAMERTGNRCDLYLYEDAAHGFFNPRNPEWFEDTLLKTEEFLRSLDYIR